LFPFHIFGTDWSECLNCLPYHTTIIIDATCTSIPSREPWTTLLFHFCLCFLSLIKLRDQRFHHRISNFEILPIASYNLDRLYNQY
jgi:hypothetical protein